MQTMSNILKPCWNCKTMDLCVRLPTVALKTLEPMGYRFFCNEECHGAWLVEEALTKPDFVRSPDPVMRHSFKVPSYLKEP